MINFYYIYNDFSKKKKKKKKKKKIDLLCAIPGVYQVLGICKNYGKLQGVCLVSIGKT